MGEELSRLQRLAKLVPQQNYGEEVLAARVPGEGHLRALGAARARGARLLTNQDWA